MFPLLHPLPYSFSTTDADKSLQSLLRGLKFLMMGFQAPTLCLTPCSLSPRLFILLSHVNPVPISTCPRIAAPALAAAEQRTNKFRVCFWVLLELHGVSVWQVTFCWH